MRRPRRGGPIAARVALGALTVALGVVGAMLLLGERCQAMVDSPDSEPANASAGEDRAAVGRLSAAAFMTGLWVFENDSVRVEECWLAPHGGLMLGVHRTVRNGRAFFENLRIEERGGEVLYIASPMGRGTTEFRLVDVTEGKVAFVNPDHDFPQRITYWMESDRLHAEARGPGGDGERVERWSWSRASF